MAVRGMRAGETATGWSPGGRSRQLCLPQPRPRPRSPSTGRGVFPCPRAWQRPRRGAHTGARRSGEAPLTGIASPGPPGPPWPPGPVPGPRGPAPPPAWARAAPDDDALPLHLLLPHFLPEVHAPVVDREVIPPAETLAAFFALMSLFAWKTPTF